MASELLPGRSRLAAVIDVGSRSVTKLAPAIDREACAALAAQHRQLEALVSVHVGELGVRIPAVRQLVMGPTTHRFTMELMEGRTLGAVLNRGDAVLAQRAASAALSALVRHPVAEAPAASTWLHSWWSPPDVGRLGAAASMKALTMTEQATFDRLLRAGARRPRPPVASTRFVLGISGDLSVDNIVVSRSGAIAVVDPRGDVPYDRADRLPVAELHLELARLLLTGTWWRRLRLGAYEVREREDGLTLVAVDAMVRASAIEFAGSVVSTASSLTTIDWSIVLAAIAQQLVRDAERCSASHPRMALAELLLAERAIERGSSNLDSDGMIALLSDLATAT